MRNNLFNIIQKAQSILTTRSYDLGHDAYHHFKVWENCLHIILNENLEKQIDTEVIQIASWWHDIEKGNYRHKELQNILDKFKYDYSQIEKIKTIIELVDGPDFNRNASSTEAKILYDADKIEYISISRWEYLKLAGEAQKIPLDRLEYYAKELSNRIERVYKTLSFKYSRTKFKENLRNFILKYKRETDESYIKNYLDISLLENILSLDQEKT